PGTTPAYSNYGIALAGYVVQQVSGLDFADYANQHIFGPAGMDTATMAQPLPPDLAEQMATGYGDLRSASIPFEHIGMAPAGSMSATAPDMSAFMLAHLAGVDDGAASSQVLSPESVAAMQQPPFGEESLGGLANGNGTALGWWEQDRNGHRIVGHAGDTLAFHAELQLYPEAGTGIYVALNSAGVRSESTSALRAQVMHGFADRYFPDTTEAPQATDTAAEHAEMLAGSYMPTRAVESNFVRSNSFAAPVSITAIGDGTITVAGVVDASGAPMRLVEVEPWVWQEVGGQQRIAVDVTDDQVRVVSIHPAMALQPLPASMAVAQPVGIGALVVLVVALIGWPASALVRRRYRVRAALSRGQRRWRLAAMLGAVLALVSEAVWALVATTLIGAGEPSAGLIRLAQVLTLAGALGLIPAAARLVGSVRERRWWPALCNLALTLGFAGIGYVAIVGRALSLDITY
ncbi:MAG TPA: serine hydrolase domain-containing protein, partial [Beutenbergiaceae bacterium]|nr:serine hydrolase domain-containing protein [Beutenbergiaceae bacterium]